MAKKSVIARANRTPKYSSRVVRRCFKCGRKHGYMRDFDLCRICFRELANEGKLPGVTKSSWQLIQYEYYELYPNTTNSNTTRIKFGKFEIRGIRM